MASVLLTCAPIAVATTFTTIAQLALAGIVPPAKAADAPPASALTAPPHELLASTPLAAFWMPAGYVSSNDALLIAIAFGLVSVIVICDAAPSGTVAGAKAFDAVGAASVVVVSVPLAPGLSTALPEVIVPVELKYVPASAAVTLISILQTYRNGMRPPVSSVLVPPFAAVTAPPQVLPAMTVPLGTLVRPLG